MQLRRRIAVGFGVKAAPGSSTAPDADKADVPVFDNDNLFMLEPDEVAAAARDVVDNDDDKDPLDDADEQIDAEWRAAKRARCGAWGAPRLPDVGPSSAVAQRSAA